MTELDRLCRAEWGRLLSALIHSLGDFDAAEDALQEAFAAAVTQWTGGFPRNPCGWLYVTARRRAIDRLRTAARLAEKRPELTALAELEASAAGDEREEGPVPDERLRLIFTCCHPALTVEAQVALTLRSLCGLGTEEIARAFLSRPRRWPSGSSARRPRSARRGFPTASRSASVCRSGSPP